MRLRGAGRILPVMCGYAWRAEVVASYGAGGAG